MPKFGLVTAALCGLALALSGCGEQNTTTDTDRARLAALLREPVLTQASPRPSGRPGLLLDETTGWDRGQVDAVLYRAGSSSTEQLRQQATTVLGRLRASGWRLLYAECVPPTLADTTGRAEAMRSVAGRRGYGLDGWNWTAYLYRSADGLSRWAALHAGLDGRGAGAVELTLRVPHQRDRAELFPERPAGLAAGASCLERTAEPAAVVRAGTPIELAARWVAPREAARPRDPLLR